MKKLFIFVMCLTLSLSVHAQNILNPTSSSLGVSLLSQESQLGVGQIILTAKIRLAGKNVTAAAPDTGPFTVPCGLQGGDLVLNVQLIAERLKLKGRDVKVADLKVQYSTGGEYREAHFDERDGWSATIPLDSLEPDVRVISFDVLYKSGRTYTKLLGFITIAASDSKNRVQAARTMAFAEYEGPNDREGVWNWQVLMGGATLTGQALPAGGVAPLFTPQSVKDALYRNAAPVRQDRPRHDDDEMRIPKNEADRLLDGMDGVSPVKAPKEPATPLRRVQPFQVESTTRNGRPVLRIVAEAPLELSIIYSTSDKQQLTLKKGQAASIEDVPGLTIKVSFTEAGKRVTKTITAEER